MIALDNRLYRVRSEHANRDRYAKPPFRQENRGFRTYASPGVAPMETGQVVIDGDTTSIATMSSDDSRRIAEIRQMEKERRRQVCYEEGRCFYCKELVGNPPLHTASNCPKKVNRVVQPYSPFAKSNKELVYSTYAAPSLPVEVIPTFPLAMNSVSCPVPNSDFCKETKLDDNCPIIFKKGCRSAIIGGLLNGDVPTDLLVDSGAEGWAFMDETFAVHLNLELLDLPAPRSVLTADGKPLGNGFITKSTVDVILTFNDHAETIKFFIMPLPNTKVI